MKRSGRGNGSGKIRGRRRERGMGNRREKDHKVQKFIVVVYIFYSLRDSSNITFSLFREIHTMFLQKVISCCIQILAKILQKRILLSMLPLLSLLNFTRMAALISRNAFFLMKNDIMFTNKL